MERFLTECAKYIYNKHKYELHNICVVFPNRRSGIFFTSYLQNEVEDVVISPKILTVNELISEYSDLFQAEKLHLISILYEVFKKHTNTKETFDEFYFWGEILLADFNDIDRYLVNAKDIFTNISDIKQIESVFDYLTEEQKKALEHFWGSVAVGNRKEFQEKHIEIWEKLFAVYSDFKSILFSKKIAYGGMIYRDVVENLETEEFKFEFKKYYIVGLNALNSCEKKFFTRLQRQGKAEFLWDYDKAYIEDIKNGAGRFMRENLERFAPPGDFIFNDTLFNTSKNIEMAAVSSTYGQAQKIPAFIEQTKADFDNKFDNTAIVLADESLLFSSLGAIPESTGTVNITMGYPVKNSMIYGFLLLLINLLKNKREDENKNTVAYHRYVTDILNHQLLQFWENDDVNEYLKDVLLHNKVVIALNELHFTQFHKELFSLPEKVENYSSYFLSILNSVYKKTISSGTDNKMLPEIISSIYNAVEKLDSVIKNVLKEQNRKINDTIYFRLFSQYIGNVSVAFEGEPLSGLQVMGILETRCLDFKNIIILGLNENKWPRTYTAPSFIPHNIRKGFGLPGIDEQDAMYSYYFYRLIQRAKNITATYSVLKQGISTGELSRYGYQLLYDSAHRPKLSSLDFSFKITPEKPIAIPGSNEITKKLLAYNSTEHPLSPSAINAYLQCRLKFYFRYVIKLPEPEEIKEEIDGMIFGNIFHDTVETIYKPFEGKVMNKSDFEQILKNDLLLKNEILKQISYHYFRKKTDNPGKVKLEGKSVLINENLITYIKQLLRIDKNLAPFTLISVEDKHLAEIEIKIDNKPVTIYLGGRIDRIDKVNGTTRILDYKTGKVENFNFNDIDKLFEQDLEKPLKEILQALIYTWAVSENINDTNIQPVIYSTKEFFAEEFDPEIKERKESLDFGHLKKAFVEKLTTLVTEIYSPENVFTQTESQKSCRYCAYKKICRKF